MTDAKREDYFTLEKVVLHGKSVDHEKIGSKIQADNPIAAVEKCLDKRSRRVSSSSVVSTFGGMGLVHSFVVLSKVLDTGEDYENREYYLELV